MRVVTKKDTSDTAACRVCFCVCARTCACVHMCVAACSVCSCVCARVPRYTDAHTWHVVTMQQQRLMTMSPVLLVKSPDVPMMYVAPRWQGGDPISVARDGSQRPAHGTGTKDKGICKLK